MAEKGQIPLYGMLHSETAEGYVADINQIKGSDSLMSNIEDGSITSAKLDENLQSIMERAQSAVQPDALNDYVNKNENVYSPSNPPPMPDLSNYYNKSEVESKLPKFSVSGGVLYITTNQ